jgi:hypothetical protein
VIGRSRLIAKMKPVPSGKVPVPVKPPPRTIAGKSALATLAQFRSPDAKPVTRLALGSSEHLAVAQKGDRRGPPDAPFAIVDVRKGEVVSALTARSRFATIGGCQMGDFVSRQNTSNALLPGCEADPLAESSFQGDAERFELRSYGQSTGRRQ